MRQITEVNERSSSIGEFDPLAPADKKIGGGYFLHGAVTGDDLDEVQFRLELAFEEMRADKSREAGSCLAYGFNVLAVDQEVIDEILLETAMAQNHGMLTQNALTSIEHGAHMLWKGIDGDRQFTLGKCVGPIALAGGDVAISGLVYSLVSGTDQFKS